MSEPLAAESGHWYFPTGEPCFTVKGAKGQDVTPDIRHARKYGLFPGVTSITRLLAAPGLVEWMINEAIMAALTLPRHEGETDQEFVARVKFDAKERGKKAAERGTALHADIERAIRKEPHGHEEHVKAVERKMAEKGLDLYAGEAEHSFAHPYGYGGKIDYHLKPAVTDFKSKDRIEDGKKLAWDEHCIQLAAYGMGLGIEEPKGYNVFVGIEDAKAVIVEHSPEDMERGKQMFIALLTLWKSRNRI